LISTWQAKIARAGSIADSSEVSLVLVNNIREHNGLDDLSWSPRLAGAARDKALDMRDYEYFDHISPRGTKAWTFILNENYEYLNAGENLAIDYIDVEAATVAWEASPAHMKNIVSSDYSEFGFAQIKMNIKGRMTDVYVQIFGREKPVYDRILKDIIE
jgi:uncharacterized protein YkwD